MSINVLYLTGTYPCASESFIAQDVRLLVKLGLPLRLLALNRGAEPQPATVEQIPVMYLGQRLDFAVAAAPADFRNRLRAVLPETVQTWLRLRRYRPELLKLCELAKASGAKHIHAEFAGVTALLAQTAAKRLTLTYSVGVHARDVFAPTFDLSRLLLKAKFVTACNQAAQRAVLTAVPELAGRLHYLRHGLYLDEWPFRTRNRTESASITKEKPAKLLFVGRLVEKKGLELLLRALASLNRDSITAELHVLGDGSLADRLKTLAAELGITPQIHWHGWLPPEDVRKYMQLSDILVVPSVTGSDGDRDGIPNVMLQAMAGGLPVVGTLTGSISEVLDENTGWVCACLEPEILAQTLKNALNAPETTARRAGTARKLLESEFDAEKLAVQRLKLFANMVPIAGVAD